MLSPRRLHELLDFHAGNAEVLSVYIDLDSKGTPQAYKSILQQTWEREVTLREFSKDLERVERCLSELKPGLQRGVALFSAEALGLWEACLLPYNFKSLLTLDRRPYLAPLLSIMEQHQRYGVVVLGPDSERIFEVHMGQIEEPPEEAGRPRPLGRRAPPEPEPPHARLRTVASRAAWLARSRRWDRLILGAPRELEPLFVGHLPLRLRNDLILDATLRQELPPSALLEKVTANEREARKVRESVLVHRLEDAAGAEGPGVLGLARTLEALQKGLVRTLLVRNGLSKIGCSCGACGHLSLSDKKWCRLCGQPMSQIFNLIAEMVQCALDQDCEVFPILYDTRLDSFGRIGAELSHGPQSAAPPGDKSRPFTIPL